MLRSAVVTRRATRASAPVFCHRRHSKLQHATTLVRAAIGGGNHPFDRTASPSRSAGSSTRGGGPAANLSGAVGVFDGLKSGGASDAPPFSFARARKSTAAALVEDEHEEVSGGAARRSQASGSGTDTGGTLKSFPLTDVGEGIVEVEVLQWFVAAGDRVRQFDKLCEVQSDKANVEITSRYDGVVRKIHWTVGEMVQTGDVLVDIEELTVAATGSSSLEEAFLSSADAGGPELSSPPSSASASASIPVPVGITPDLGGDTAAVTGEGAMDGPSRRQVLATPAVRRICREMSVDLSTADITGTGTAGRVLKGDVLAYVAGKNAGAITTGEGVPSGSGRSVAGVSREKGSADAAEVLVAGSVGRALDAGFKIRAGALGTAGSGGLVEEEPLRRPAKEERRAVGGTERRDPVAVPIKGIQKAMMKTMKKALEVPHFNMCDEINADRLALLRSDLKEAAERRGVKLSYMPLIVKATSMALAAFPSLNASLSEDKTCVLQHPDHNIGVAMDTERGLLVPCISAVQEKSILDIAEELNTLQRLGAAGKLGEAELGGTTFTLSNIGSIGGTYGSPVILHPQVCIGVLGRMQRVPRFDPVDIDKVVAARVFPVSWAADHRTVDGATLARFSNMWKGYLENPASMLGDAR